MALTQSQDVAITPPPLKIAGLLQAKWANAVLQTALELDVFTAMQKSAMTSEELAATLQLDGKAARLLLEALASMEFATCEAGRFGLTDMARAYLVKGSNLYMGDYIISRSDMQSAWENLTATIRSGKPYKTVNEPSEAAKFFPELARMIFPLNYSNAQLLADKLGIKSIKEPVKVLDLAAGTGVWSLPMAQSNKLVHVDALDFASVLEVTKEYATKYGVAEQYGYLTGSWQEVKLPEAHYDVVILGHILHSEGKELSEKLLSAIGKALKPKGRLVVAEFFAADNRELSPLFSSLFAINMLLATTDGCVFSVNELKTMIEHAGMCDAERVELPFWGKESPLMVARK